jgi:hypothetical protein
MEKGQLSGNMTYEKLIRGNMTSEQLRCYMTNEQLSGNMTY